ncbi:alpha/beta fold hydrolase [Williamsia sp. CHRR-6]|uniref:alpha/beta fold hydrolase n=1 Tax=Williamsia sp. CHRR-6 TaxID=2835871 RepID=UPI001BDA949C|nr:alpha/beta hydrolase [Williamsia sp. CHRR-6]MBT0567945.1 alpha/beta hydrolase [Williamsia sp. CHRR-6]
MRVTEPSTAARSRPITLVALPGTGSDGDYVRRLLSPLAQGLAIELVAVDPGVDGIDRAYRAALDAAAERGPVLVAGVSIGACIAARWAVHQHDSCHGVIAILPPWVDRADDAIAAISARATAEAITRDGLAATIEAMRAGAPPWLAEELSRSWQALGAGLVTQLSEAARHHGPGAEVLAALDVPLAVVAAVDDPIHPVTVAQRWAALASHSAIATITIESWSCADPQLEPSRVGVTALRLWRELIGPR